MYTSKLTENYQFSLAQRTKLKTRSSVRNSQLYLLI